MSTWADQHGFAAITVSEHHGVDFISAPVTMAAMLLGRTKNAFVTVNALLVPLHDPVRLAEQVATIDLMSGGRFRFVAGLGYKVEEFEMAGVEPEVAQPTEAPTDEPEPTEAPTEMATEAPITYTSHASR